MVMSLCRGSWKVNSTMCGCVAGKGPRASCKHIGALCYAVANFCLYGQLPDFLTCTDVKQVWNIPAPKKDQPTTVDQLKVRRRELLGKPTGYRASHSICFGGLTGPALSTSLAYNALCQEHIQDFLKGLDFNSCIWAGHSPSQLNNSMLYWITQISIKYST